ncbi:MAG: hypothetical protein ACLFRB_09720 [Thiohalorhabdus sp.]|uniref:hypothetical protein n=1 Tax=Thiohalorhabdus sp. TaxID=3094134 RepID=UPI0039803D3C
MKQKDWKTNLDTAHASLRAQEEILERLRREVEDGEDPYIAASQLLTRWQFLRTHFRQTQLALLREAGEIPDLNDYQRRRTLDSLELRARQLDASLSSVLSELERQEERHPATA